MKISYPDCSINPKTEKPYTRHKWMIPNNQSKPKLIHGSILQVYRVRCERCGLNDPNPPLH